MTEKLEKLSLDYVLSKADALPALPQIVTRILESLADDAASVDMLSEHISGDPTVSVRILGAANAGAFGGHAIQSLKQAILLLGLSRVREITLATAIIERYTAQPPFDAHKLWLHSLGVAVCARDIALYAGYDADAAAVAGLLHDIGQLLLFGVQPLPYVAALRFKDERDIGIIEAEQEVLGVDHAQVGAALVRLWHLPEPVAAAIGGHHTIEGDGPGSEIADVVHVAEVLSHALNLGNLENNRVPSLSDIAVARLGIDWSEFAEHFPRIEARFDGARTTLGL